MARNREFDYQEILSKAINLFWQKGYHNTTIQDLVDHLNLGRSSIYNAFGNKHQLFLEALDNYIWHRDTELKKKLKVLPVKETIKKFLYGIIDEIISEKDNQGCFIVNTMTELADTDDEVFERLKKSEKNLVCCYEEALCFAKANGELSSHSNPYELAIFLSNMMKGIRVMSKVNKSREDFEAIIKIALNNLE